ncbi:unnamed protein product, partial [Adineta ricciae]
YALGCATTIALLVYLYMRHGLSQPEPIAEQNQYQTFQPLPENFRSKNSTVDTINCIFQFVFQELKDSSRIRRYIVKKLNVEFDDLRNTRLGKLFLRDIVIQSFSLGKECPVLSDIQFERHERDEQNLIKECQATFHADYQDGFSVTLDITLAFEQTCQLYIKIKRIRGDVRLELRREPFSHWLLVFQGEPLIDLDVKSYVSNRETAQLAQIIKQQIRRAIQRKQIWPNYKIRYQPFFPTSHRSSAKECLEVINPDLIPGKFHIKIKSCDRLSIPYEIYNQQTESSLFIFLTINVNKYTCEDYLCVNRDQWKTYQCELSPQCTNIRVKEVLYMDRVELLIEQLDPIPDEFKDQTIFEEALKDKNIFLLEIQGKHVDQLKQVIHLLKHNQKVQLVVAIPVLQSVQIPRAVETAVTEPEFTETLRRRFSVKTDTNQERTDTKLTNSPADTVHLMMANSDLLDSFQARPTLTQKPSPYVEFNYESEFRVGSDEEYLNICLWCKPPLDCNVPNISRKHILLGYATVSLAEIVLNAHMSFKRETQMTLNFRSPISPKSNIEAYRKDPKRQKLSELTTHKKYDDHMAHGFVTIRIRHEPEIENRRKQEAKRQRSFSFETIIVDSEQLSFAEQPIPKSPRHIFEDQIFSVGVNCALCQKRVWMKAGRQCRDCSVTVHRACEENFVLTNFCTHENMRSRSSTFENDSIENIDQTNVRRTTSKATNKNEQFEHINADKRPFGNQSIYSSSKLAGVASSAYNKLREIRTKRSHTASNLDLRKPRSSSASENVSENDLQVIFSNCLNDNNVDMERLENLFREKAVDHAALYAEANTFGVELFKDLDLEERKQKLEDQVRE